MKKFFKKENRGITLVALVITIIILLILAAISIQAITNTGLFAQAENAKRESEIASIKEQIALDIYEKQLEPPLGSITEEQIETILGKYGTVNKEDGKIVGITTAKGYEILLKDIYGGETVAESVPDGATVIPVNDIITWLKTGEISKQYSYTTIEQVIADSTCTKSLMNNENAMKYLARSTEFADAICASETAMMYLGQSSYVDDTVLNSDLWVSKIKSSSYWDKIYTQKFTIYGGAYETITISGYSGSFTTNANGSVSHALPLGTITLNGSVSGQSFERTIDDTTTDVYVMPEGIILYWYGNFMTINGLTKSGFHHASGNTINNGIITINTNYFKLNTNSSYGACSCGSTNTFNIPKGYYGNVIARQNKSTEETSCFITTDKSNDGAVFTMAKVDGSASEILTYKTKSATLQSYSSVYFMLNQFVSNPTADTDIFALWFSGN